MYVKIRTFIASIVMLCAGFTFIAAPAFADQPANSAAGGMLSYNWAGYVAQNGNYTSVSGSWVVPQISQSTTPGADAAWVGIGGVTGSDLIQTGTQAMTNPAGQVSYQAWYETLPQTSQTIPLTINVGDSVSASITEQSTNQWLISFTDNTSGKNFQTSISYNSSLSSAEWVEEMPLVNNGFAPLDNFGTVQFSGGSAVQNGSSVTIAGAGAQTMSMVNSGNQVLASVSPLGIDGQSFSVTRSSVASTGSSGYATTRGNGFGRRGGMRVQRIIIQSSAGNNHIRQQRQYTLYSMPHFRFSVWR